jgi:hypothetical protein
MFHLAGVVAASLISFNISVSRAADNGPDDGLVRNEIVRSNYFQFASGAITPTDIRKPSFKSKLEGADLLEWTTGDDVIAATYGNVGGEGKGGGGKNFSRLTQIELKKGELSAVTTTFFKNGLRSKTECIGKTSSTLKCATASRNLCQYFKENMNEDGAKLGFIKEGGAVSPDVKKRMLVLGEQCSEYASFLKNLLDPNEAIVTGSSRGNRDSELVEKDLQAIDAVRKAGQSAALKNASFKGLNDMWSKGDDVGASSTGMRNRSDRLQEIGADFKVMSRLAFTCADAKFTEEFEGANEHPRQRPRKSNTRP